VVAGLVVIGLVDWRFGLGLPEAVHTEFSATLLGLLLCALPAAISGFVEDVTKKVSVKVRLLATIASGLLACVFIDAVIPKFDVWGLDSLMAYSAFAMLATAFCAGGVANAVNIIDGFNGLAAGALVLIASGFALLGASVNDPTLVLLALSVAAVSAGFMVVNYPSGRLFLGDGGAYLLGFLVAELAILTAARHPELNAFTVLTLVSYPVLEVVVSVVRRKLKKASPGDPDRGHLHQQIQVALRHVFGRLAESQRTQQLRAHVPSVNAQVSPLVWVMVAGTVFTALVFKNAGAWVSLGFAFCTVLYVVVYRMVMAFNTQAERRRVVFRGSLEVKPLAEQGQVVEGVNKGEDAAQTQVAEKLRKTA
jgi:UDP-N-acetylmuramyl pentapeptide phosphotransferase/UDP-N-acetylglucosamine-1-phosphate transferase